MVEILIGQAIQKDKNFNEPDASYGKAKWGEVVPQLTGANVSFAVKS